MRIKQKEMKNIVGIMGEIISDGDVINIKTTPNGTYFYCNKDGMECQMFAKDTKLSYGTYSLSYTDLAEACKPIKSAKSYITFDIEDNKLVFAKMLKNGMSNPSNILGEIPLTQSEGVKLDVSDLIAEMSVTSDTILEFISLASKIKPDEYLVKYSDPVISFNDSTITRINGISALLMTAKCVNAGDFNKPLDKDLNKILKDSLKLMLDIENIDLKANEDSIAILMDDVMILRKTSNEVRKVGDLLKNMFNEKTTKTSFGDNLTNFRANMRSIRNGELSKRNSKATRVGVDDAYASVVNGDIYSKGEPKELANGFYYKLVTLLLFINELNTEKYSVLSNGTILITGNNTKALLLPAIPNEKIA